jgi:hypothetical protein
MITKVPQSCIQSQLLKLSARIVTTAKDFVVVVVKVQTKQPTEPTQPETIGCCTQLFSSNFVVVVIADTTRPNTNLF